MANTIDEVMRKAKKIEHEQTRRESEDYLEMVMFSRSMSDLGQLFEGYFGPALKRSGEEPPAEAEQLTNRYGGIAKDQVLYHAERDSARHLAMVWPWADGKRMTVKIIQESP
jgi:hypothetical protein